MSDKALYVLAGLNEDTQDLLAEYQTALTEKGYIGTQTKNIPYHITLGSFSTDCENMLAKKLNDYALTNPSVELMYNYIGIFGGGKVLFVCPDATHQLLALKEAFNDNRDWTAHTTLLIDESEIVLDAAKALLSSFKPFSAKIDSLHLYEFFPTRHILSVKLK